MKLLKNTEKISKLHGRWYGDACGAAFALELIGERWAMLVIRELMLGGRRFSQLRAELPGISAKILTERLGKLEQAGILTKRTLPPPASAQIYELTEWGLATERIMQELGRWAVQSPSHDPTLPLSPVSFMLSLRAMFDPAAAPEEEIIARFDFASSRFRAHLHDGLLDISRADAPEEQKADIVFQAPSPNACLPVFYDKQPLDTPGLEMTVEGETDLAQRFIDLFALPPKIG